MASKIVDYEEAKYWEEIGKNYNSKQITGIYTFGPDKQALYSDYARNKDKVKNMVIREDDVWVLGFPRSGTTLTQEMVWQLGNNIDIEKGIKLNLAFRSVFLEHGLLFSEDTIKESVSELEQNGPFNYLDFDVITNLPSPRFYKSHLSLSLLPDDLLDKAKVVYVVRNVRDVMVSMYNFERMLAALSYNNDFKTYWKSFMEGKVISTPYFTYLKRAWNVRNHPNFLFLYYEDIIKDLKGTVLKVSKFLNKQYTVEQIDRLCEHLSFDSMKKNTAVQPNELNMENYYKQNDSFIRKGKVGGWRQHFDDGMIKKTDEWIAENLADTDFKFRD